MKKIRIFEKYDGKIEKYKGKTGDKNIMKLLWWNLNNVTRK